MDIGKAAYDLVANRHFHYNGGNGLSVSFGKGKLRTSDGSYITFNGGTVSVPDNNTCEIMLDLFGNNLHAFPRALHRGAVHIATVTTASGRVQSVVQPDAFILPKGRIEKFKRKIRRAGQYVRIALIGDSLTQGAGGATNRWTSVLFNPSYSSYGFNLSRLTNVISDNYAVGGQTSRYGAVILGRSIQSDSSQYDQTAITYGPYYGGKMSFNYSFQESPVLVGQYDLAIVSFGANGGTNNLAFFENIVKELRKRGTEVIVTSSNNKISDSNFLYSDSLVMAQMADVWGCEFADTWSYMKEGDWNGQTTHFDDIHQSDAGHLIWAQALRSIINDRMQETEVCDVTNSVRVITDTDSTLSSKFPNTTDIQFVPFGHTGTNTSGLVTTASFNPSILFGGRTASNYVYQLANTQYAQYAHANAHAVDFLVDANSVFTADIYSNNGGNKIGTISNASANNRIILIEGVPLGIYGDTTNGKPGYENRGVRVTVTSGTASMVGAVFHTWNKIEVPFKNIEFGGTWLEEAWTYGHPSSKYSDTTGDSFTFEFDGTGCQLLFSGRTAAGKLDIWLDGIQLYTAVDLYETGSHVRRFDLFPLASSNFFDRGYGRHVVRVKLNSVNATADAATSATNRRLQLLAAYIFDSR